MENNNWFEVSREGLKQLQSGKAKSFVLRELVQNAWDEDGVTFCHVKATYKDGLASVSVEDDAPEGFKDITHAFTLFAPTYKRKDAEKRGRFNIGEKQVLALCKAAIVSTTKGTIEFTKEGRKHKALSKKSGSIISILIEMTEAEYKEMVSSVVGFLSPKGIEFKVNGGYIPYREPHKIVGAPLPTEVQKNDKTVYTTRKTKVHIHKANGVAFLYEMGLPICEIECPFHVDIQQKVPVSLDREKVSQAYLSRIFTVVLNETFGKVDGGEVSNGWVREAMEHKDVSEEVVHSIVKERYGGKVVIATPGDKVSADEALSKGYKVLRGNELSPQEWSNIRKVNAIESSSKVFPTDVGSGAIAVKPDAHMKVVRTLVRKIASLCLGVDVKVRFSKWTAGNIVAQYGSRTLTFNVGKLGKGFFNPALSPKVLDLILHELAHEKGLHTEASYHECLSRMGSELTMVALGEPGFFNGFINYPKEVK